MREINVAFDKTLKLMNVLIFDVALENNPGLDIGVEIVKMENYIKSKGQMPVGPLVQYTSTQLRGDGSLNIDFKLMLQANGFIDHTEPPYSMESVHRAKNCMYTRFVGAESDLGFAFDKIKVAAYENEIALLGSSYLVMVEKNDDVVVADVFMEKKNAEESL